MKKQLKIFIAWLFAFGIMHPAMGGAKILVKVAGWCIVTNLKINIWSNG